MGTPLVLADDLSGAAETAAALGTHLRPALHLWPDAPSTPTGRPVVLDLDSRHLPPADAAARVTAALAAIPEPAPLFKKIDSLLRGNVAAEAAPLLDAGAPVVVTPALPQQGRTVTGGVLHDKGVPLHRTTLWALEPTAPPQTVAAALDALPVRTIDLDIVRSHGLTAALADAAGAVAVCDAETQADLDAIVAAGLEASPRVRLVGSSDLARALGPHLTRPRDARQGQHAPATGGSVLFVLGTGSEAAVAQAGLLLQRVDAASRPMPARDLAGLDAPAAAERGRALASDLTERSVVVQVTAEDGPPQDGTAIVAGLARLVSATLDAAPGWPVRLMLTGGQTARAVLDELGCRRLTLLDEIHPGAVLMTTDAGWLVATRPGSHGGRDSLVAVHHALTHPLHPTQEDS